MLNPQIKLEYDYALQFTRNSQAAAMLVLANQIARLQNPSLIVKLDPGPLTKAIDHLNATSGR
jgi:hypothetical protein